MKKYLKMIGLALLYALVPLVLDLTLLHFIQNTEPMKSIAKVTPTAFFAIFDPLSIIALILLVKFVLKKDPFKTTSFNKISASNGVMCGLIGILMAFFTFSLINMDFMKNHIPQISGSIHWIVGGNLLLVIYVVLVNSFYKEYCFRGLIFNELKNNIPLILAIILQAMVYFTEVVSLDQFSIATYAFIGQLLFGIIFYVGGSIWASMITQFICTLSLAVLVRIPVDKLFTNLNDMFIFPISILLIIIAVMMVYRSNKDLLAKNRGVGA